MLKILSVNSYFALALQVRRSLYTFLYIRHDLFFVLYPSVNSLTKL